MIGIAIGIMLRSGTSLSNPYVPGGLGPETASFNANQTAGTIIFEITGLVSDEYVTSFTPSDGRLALDATKTFVVVGATASTGGSIVANFYTNKGRRLQTTITINSGTLTLQSIGKKTASGVKVNPIVALNTGATITAGNAAGHFAISSGFITVTSTGDTADLNLGPYTLTISGDSNYTSVVVPIETAYDWYSVTTEAEMRAAVTAAKTNTPTVRNKVEVPDGVTINPRSPTDTSQTLGTVTLPNASTFTGSVSAGFDTFSDGIAQIRNRIYASGLAAQGSYTSGGYCEITCRTPGYAFIDQTLSYTAGSRGLLFTNLRWIATAPVSMYIPVATAKWLPNQVAGFSGGLTPSLNEIGADITATGVLGALTRVSAGSGGTNGTYNLTITGGGGTGAAGTFTVVGGALSTLTITNAGSGYTGNPTVTLDPAANLTGASATATIGYNGGTGYLTGETWTYSPDGIGTISGTITATAGVITAATITSKTAGIDAKLTGPICLTTTASGNGITSASGVGGTIAITHDNYSFGPPPGAATYSLLNNVVSSSQLSGSASPTYPSGFTDIIFKNCFFGSHFAKPDNPNQWISAFGANCLRTIRNGVVEDNQFKGFRNGMHINLCRLMDIRRNDMQLYYEDAIRIFESTAYAGNISEMNASTANDFASAGQQITVNQYYNNIHNNLHIASCQNLHSDGMQRGTQANIFGTRGAVYNERIVHPFGSTQGIYNDDAFRALLGIDLVVDRCLIMTAQDQTSGIVAFRGRDAEPSTYTNNTLIQLAASAAQNINNGTSIPRRGAGSGYLVDNNIYGCFYDDTGRSLASTTIVNGGSGYASGDKIVWQNPYGIYGYGTLNVSAGVITGVTWTAEPNGFQSTTAVTITAQKTLAQYLGVPDGTATDVVAIFTDTGTGGSIRLTPSGSLGTQYYYTNPGTITMGAGAGLGTAKLTRNVSVLPWTDNTGGGTSLEETIVGPFTRIDTGSVKGWSFTDVDHTPANFRTAIDAIFTPKTGGAGVGAGHLSTAADWVLAVGAWNSAGKWDNTQPWKGR